MTMRAGLSPGLYGIADGGIGDPVETAVGLAEAGCGTIQLRCKDWAPSRILDAARHLAPQLRDRQVCFVVNDHPDIARAVDADGVHLGQADGSIAEARAIIGPHQLIGWSTHDLAQVRAASAADYLGFGPVYSTHSKRGALPPRGIAQLVQAVQTAHCPVVAIGGIGPECIAEIKATGAYAWACIGALRATRDLAEAVRQLQG